MNDKCLITKLNAVVDNPNLPIYGKLMFTFGCSNTTASKAFGQGGIIGDESTTIKVSDGIVVDSEGVTIGDGHNFSSIGSNYYFLADNDHITIEITDNYSLSDFGAENRNDTISGISIDDFVYRASTLTTFVFYHSSLSGADNAAKILDVLSGMQNNGKNLGNVTLPTNASIELTDIKYVPRFNLFGITQVQGTIEDYIESLLAEGIEDGTYNFKVGVCYRITFNSQVINSTASVKSCSIVITSSNVTFSVPSGQSGTLDRTNNTWTYTE